jgi:hypothetical protein
MLPSAVIAIACADSAVADFRMGNCSALRKVCARFVELCREMGLLTTASVALDGSKFKAVNNRCSTHGAMTCLDFHQPHACVVLPRRTSSLSGERVAMSPDVDHKENPSRENPHLGAAQVAPQAARLSDFFLESNARTNLSHFAIPARFSGM